MDLGELRARIIATTSAIATLRVLAPAISREFDAEGATVYGMRDDGTLVSIAQTGLSNFRFLFQIKPTQGSVAGYVARERRVVNISDVHDPVELAAFTPPITWYPEIERKTHQRTTQMLCAPILATRESDRPQGTAVGVLQLINRRDHLRFPPSSERDIELLCSAIATALARKKAYVPEHRRRQRELTEVALREDAPEQLAIEREDLLQHFRDRHNRRVGNPLNLNYSSRWTADDVFDLGWICRLAAAGHLGAKNLMDSVLQPYTDSHTLLEVANQAESTRPAFEALGEEFPQVAIWIAVTECFKGAAIASRVLHWLERSGPEYSELALAIRQSYPGEVVIPSDETAVIVKLVDPSRWRATSSLAEAVIANIERVRERRRALGVETLTINHNIADSILADARKHVGRQGPSGAMVEASIKKRLESVFGLGAEPQKQEARELLERLPTRKA
jgi:hypothetical protein